MHTLSGTLRFIPVLAAGLAFAVSGVRGDDPQNPQATPGQWQSQNQYNGVAEIFSLISQEAGQQLASRPAEQLSEFWIGVSGNPVDDVLRLHLDLSENQGMLITEVLADSPASKAGLKSNDVLVAAGEKPVKESADLAAVIAEKKETQLALRLIRAGKPIIIEITPARRPASQTGETCPAISKAADAEFVNRVYLDLTGVVADAERIRRFAEDKEADKRAKLVNKLLRNSTVTNKSCVACHSTDDTSWALSRQLLGLRALSGNDRLAWETHLNPLTSSYVLNYPHPGIIFTEGTITERGPTPDGLPEDVTITITRKGQTPAQITVRRGEQIWDAAADNYQEKIPADLLPYVTRWMSGVRERLALGQWLNAGQAHADTDHLASRALSLRILTNQNQTKSEVDAARLLIVEKEIDSLNQQLSQIQQSLEKLRKSLHGSTDGATETPKK